MAGKRRCKMLKQDTVTEAVASVPVVDNINSPAHYGSGGKYETIKVIEAWGFLDNFLLGNTLKYISRCEKKGNALEDLMKARYYLNWEIARREKQDGI
jgi:Protein of unknwon function (DUF3310)